MALSTVKGLYSCISNSIAWMCLCAFRTSVIQNADIYLERCAGEAEKKYAAWSGADNMISRNATCMVQSMFLLIPLALQFQSLRLLSNELCWKFFPFLFVCVCAPSLDTANGIEQLKCVQGFAYMPHSLSDMLRAGFFFLSVVFGCEILKWKHIHNQNQAQTKKNCNLYIEVLWMQSKKKRKKEMRGKVMGQIPLYEWTFRRIMSFSVSLPFVSVLWFSYLYLTSMRHTTHRIECETFLFDMHKNEHEKQRHKTDIAILISSVKFPFFFLSKKLINANSNVCSFIHSLYVDAFMKCETFKCSSSLNYTNVIYIRTFMHVLV